MAKSERNLLRRLSSGGLSGDKTSTRRQRSHSVSSDASSASSTASSTGGGDNRGGLAPPILVYHANARSIVFRDQLKRADSATREMLVAGGGEGGSIGSALSVATTPIASSSPVAAAAVLNHKISTSHKVGNEVVILEEDDHEQHEQQQQQFLEGASPPISPTPYIIADAAAAASPPAAAVTMATDYESSDLAFPFMEEKVGAGPFTEEAGTGVRTSSIHSAGEPFPSAGTGLSGTSATAGMRTTSKHGPRGSSTHSMGEPFPGAGAGLRGTSATGSMRTTSKHGPRGSSTHSMVSVDSYVRTDDPEHKHVDAIATIGASFSHVLTSAVEQDRDLHIAAQVPATQIGGYCERVQPLPTLELGPNDNFQPLLDQDVSTAQLTTAEAEVVRMLRQQKACVKTIKNTDWTAFLHRFLYAQPPLHAKRRSIHDDDAPSRERHYNSFVTSTTLLPPNGMKMRSYGSNSQYSTGVVFALPEFTSDEEEAEAAKVTNTWSWPAGYSAKTEFNRDSRGKLINGREEALVSFSTLRQYNLEYVTGTEYTVNRRRVSGINQIPYNEVFLRVGGYGRVVDGKDVATGEVVRRSFDKGVGLPVALFCRTATFGNLIALMRTRARLAHTLGEAQKTIPLVLIAPDLGIRVLTESLLQQLWKVAAQQLTPFQNPTIAHRTSINCNDDAAFQQKLEELIDFDESMQEVLTPEELARIAGGYGASDDSLAAILKQVRELDERLNKERKETDTTNASPSHKLQDVVNEGLAYAVRSGDYNTSRQLLILYSLVAAQDEEPRDEVDEDLTDDENDDGKKNGKKAKTPEKESGREKSKRTFSKRSSSMSVPDTKPHQLLDRMTSDLSTKTGTSTSTTLSIPTVPPPPPLDTDRLRGATNSDGLLAVLGAAQVLKAMQDGGAKKRTEEAISAVEEWVNYGEQSMAFRISSWYDQRAAQGDLKIATESNSQFMAFVSNKAISNRKAFVQQLREAAASTNFNDVKFLQSLHLMLSKMHSPCLRLELLQYVLGLDNRYSVAHISRSIELAATCLGISSAASVK